MTKKYYLNKHREISHAKNHFRLTGVRLSTSNQWFSAENRIFFTKIYVTLSHAGS